MTGQLIEPLSLDEETVLEIAARGQSMIPIGRWEAPTKRLAALGLLKALDEANYVITDAGRARFKVAEQDQDDAIAQVIILTKRIAQQRREEAQAALEKPDGDPD
jgi:hypothetical protein